MKKLLAIIVGLFTGVALMAGMAYVAIPLAGGPEPGDLIARPTLDDCHAFAVEREVVSASVSWIWRSEGYGWGCRYRFADGSTGEAVEVVGFRERHQRRAPP